MIDIISILASEKEIILTFALTYWLSDLFKSYIFIYRGDASIVRFFKGFQSDLVTSLIIFTLEITITFSSSIYLNELIYPVIDMFLPGFGQFYLVISAMLLFFSFILDNESNSYPNVLILLRSVSVVILLASISTVEALNSLHGIWNESWYVHPETNQTINTTVNSTGGVLEKPQ